MKEIVMNLELWEVDGFKITALDSRLCTAQDISFADLVVTVRDDQPPAINHSNREKLKSHLKIRKYLPAIIKLFELYERNTSVGEPVRFKFGKVK